MQELNKSQCIEDEQEFVRVMGLYHAEWATVMPPQKIDAFRHFFVAGLKHASPSPKTEVHGAESGSEVVLDNLSGNLLDALKAVEAKAPTPISFKDYMQAYIPEHPGALSLSEFLGMDVRLPVGPRLIRELEHRFPTEVRTNLSCTEAYIVTADSHYVDTYTIGYRYDTTAQEEVVFFIAFDGKRICEGNSPMQCLEKLRANPPA